MPTAVTRFPSGREDLRNKACGGKLFLFYSTFRPRITVIFNKLGFMLPGNYDPARCRLQAVGEMQQPARVTWCDYRAAPERKGGDPRENPADQQHRPTLYPLAKNPGVTQPGIEPGYPRWEASSLTAQPPRLLRSKESMRVKCCEYGAALECKGRGKLDIPEKTRRPAASSGTIPTCKNPAATSPGIEPGSALLGYYRNWRVGSICGRAVVWLKRGIRVKSGSAWRYHQRRGFGRRWLKRDDSGRRAVRQHVGRISGDLTDVTLTEVSVGGAEVRVHGVEREGTVSWVHLEETTDLRVQGREARGAIRATLTRTPSASSLLRARRAERNCSLSPTQVTPEEPPEIGALPSCVRLALLTTHEGHLSWFRSPDLLPPPLPSC
ncbi:hypothetical protein PR048_033560 [Dryococelus australis]|uniref:Uncharacterized protein n=1 Tax=Dryococelus australis TaxID=614101 RepID=A0ABQ9G3G0_9NEOP|nr:hypothetical protein PR048_033560 [Dryococelus australis]